MFSSARRADEHDRAISQRNWELGWLFPEQNNRKKTRAKQRSEPALSLRQAKKQHGHLRARCSWIFLQDWRRPRGPIRGADRARQMISKGPAFGLSASGRLMSAVVAVVYTHISANQQLCALRDERGAVGAAPRQSCLKAPCSQKDVIASLFRPLFFFLLFYSWKSRPNLYFLCKIARFCSAFLRCSVSKSSLFLKINAGARFVLTSVLSSLSAIWLRPQLGRPSTVSSSPRISSSINSRARARTAVSIGSNQLSKTSTAISARAVSERSRRRRSGSTR